MANDNALGTLKYKVVYDITYKKMALYALRPLYFLPMLSAHILRTRQV